MKISEELVCFKKTLNFPIFKNLPDTIKQIKLTLISSLSLETEILPVKHLVKIRETVTSKSYPTRHQSVKY